MADEIDVSQIESDFLLSLRLSKRRQYVGESAKYCIDCGDVIPLMRRNILPGVQHCIICAARKER